MGIVNFPSPEVLAGLVREISVDDGKCHCKGRWISTDIAMPRFGESVLLCTQKFIYKGEYSYTFSDNDGGLRTFFMIDDETISSEERVKDIYEDGNMKG